jgi:DNA-binding transcriptional MerR regulator
MTSTTTAGTAGDLTVGEAARRAGVSVDTLRYYEREGLLSAARTASGHRRYTPRDLEWIGVLTCLRETGMPIRRMREYAELAHEDDVATVAARLRMLEEHRAEVQERLRELHRNLEHLEGKISWYRSLPAAGGRAGTA